jgi:chitinase
MTGASVNNIQQSSPAKFFLALIVSAFITLPCIAGTDARPAVIAYYTGRFHTLQKYDLGKITHLVYGFLGFRNNRLVYNSRQDSAAVRQLVLLKNRYPHLKIILAMGGWGGCRDCSAGFSDPGTRKIFTSSVVEIMKRAGADGFDLDWEYPAIPGYPGHRWSGADRNNFTALLQELRQAFQSEQARGSDFELSFAAGAYQRALDESVDWSTVANYVDRIHLMTYDLRSSRHDSTGHHTPLLSTAGQRESVEYAVDHLLGKGVPPRKIVIGAAFYGRVFSVQIADNNGLYQPCKFKQFVLYKKIDTWKKAGSGYTFFYDSTAEAAFALNRITMQFVTFDDERSITAKAKYCRQNNLGGVMFWELSQDRPPGIFVAVINDVLYRND